MWTSQSEPLFPWAKTIDRIVASERPQAIEGLAIIVATDSGGTDHRSRYRVNVYLCVDVAASAGWERARTAIRRTFLSDGRRMAYKSLSDRNRLAAVVPFLDAAVHMHGLCLVVIVNKDLRHLCFHDSSEYERLRATANLRSRWKDRELEEAVRTTYTLALLLGGLSRPEQNVMWLSDEDNLFSNAAHAADVARLLATFTDHHVKHKLGHRMIGTTAIDEDDRQLEDLVAIPDLVAGGVAETVNRVAEVCGGRIPNNLTIEYEKELTPKAELMLRWLWRARGPLTRVVARIDVHPGAFYAVSKWDMPV